MDIVMSVLLSFLLLAALCKKKFFQINVMSFISLQIFFVSFQLRPQLQLTTNHTTRITTHQNIGDNVII
jgi:hypothetical protein